MEGSHQLGKTCQKVLSSSGVEVEHQAQHPLNKGKECKCLIIEDAFVKRLWFDRLQCFV